MADSTLEARYIFSSPEGIHFCRQTLLSVLPFCPHDYQLTGVASILDGHDLLAVSATGTGKTAYTYMTLHIIKALQNDPGRSQSVVFPSNAAVLVVSPTTALEEDQELKLRSFGLTAQAINSVTKEEAANKDINIWKQVEAETDVILVSPEMIKTPGFQYLVNSKAFCNRLFAICFDEVHLLNSWGLAFRTDFQQIAFLRKRFLRPVVLFGTTATLRIGLPMKTILGFLGFNEDNFILHRRSNARPDIKLIVRTIDATQNTESFPQLDWVLKEPGKTLIFCPTIRYGFKLAMYFWYLDIPGSVLRQNIHLFNSLNSPDYNRETMELLQGNNDSNITIATDKLSVGVDVPDFRTVIIIDPKNVDDMWQKAGRAGRDRSKVPNTQVIVYFPREVVNAANHFAQRSDRPTSLEPETSKKKRKRAAPSGNAEDIEEDRISLYRFITAPCKPAEINVQYGNHSDDEPCSLSCLTCAAFPPPAMASLAGDDCSCSGCKPEPTPPPIRKPSARSKQSPLHLRVTKAMRQQGIKELQGFRDELYFSADEASTGMPLGPLSNPPSKSDHRTIY
ncbi:P-loop containing nucleoside triphosphate hydrolase protein [Pholiota molesta]|nr:P-loop containing nucleoside triphosphate hydrolase protein [Pholiota molesta]